MITRYTIEITAQCAACGTKDSRTTTTPHSNEAMQAQGPSGFHGVYGRGINIELCSPCLEKAHIVIGDVSLPLTGRA